MTLEEKVDFFIRCALMKIRTKKEVDVMKIKKVSKVVKGLCKCKSSC